MGGDVAGMRWPSSCAGSEQVEYRCAKFHLVDLAGSERTKRTGAVGARFKETVTINQVGWLRGCCSPQLQLTCAGPACTGTEMVAPRNIGAVASCKSVVLPLM
jgi:hypothetical protein